MRSKHALVSLVVLWLLVAAGAVRAEKLITYHVRVGTSAPEYAVTITIPRVMSSSVQVQLPKWAPGAYIVGNAAQNIKDVSAETDSRRALTVTHPDPQTWEAATGGASQVRFAYTVTGVDLEQTANGPKRAHISGPRTYLYVVGRKQEPAELAVTMPTGWKFATSLDPKSEGVFSGAGPRGGGSEAIHTFSAPSYDVLADAPIEMGDYAEDNFEVRGVPHKIVLYGDYQHIDRAKLLEYCRRIAEAETAFFNDIPYKRYIFMFRASGPNGRGAGGLEHLGSTEIGLRGSIDDVVRSVIAHEFFHLWNVKRIRPFVLGPFDYIDPPHTANLWEAEGVTSYYGDLLSRRAGINTDGEYEKHLADTIALLQNDPARLKVTADESSSRVWEANNSQGYGGLSYYTKGELIGLCLDLKIRQVTNDRRSLDDVMRALYRQCGKGKGPGYGEDDIKKTVSRVSGHDLSAFYDLLARSTQEMPFGECLGYVGLKLARSDKPEAVANLGMTIRPDPDFKALRIRSVDPDGPAAKVGLKAENRIVAVGGTPLSSRNGFFSLRSAKPGATLVLTVERDGKSEDVSYTVGSQDRFPWLLTADPAATPEQVHVRETWLKGTVASR